MRWIGTSGVRSPSRVPRRELGVAAALALAVTLGGCVDEVRVVPPQGAWPSPAGNAPAPWVERGLASYYADRLVGRRTSSGQPYDPLDLTAAHRTLPFGAIVEVVRDDGRHVAVRVNDRGPGVEGRVIDLSRAAAELLGMTREGIVPVTVRVVWWPTR